MAWRIVIQPNGKYARFSDVVDDFTHFDMTRAEAVTLCEDYTGKLEASAKVQRADDAPERFADEIATIKAVHGQEVADAVVRQLGRVSDTTATPKK